MSNETSGDCDPDWVIEQFKMRDDIIRRIGWPLICKVTQLDSMFLLRVLSPKVTTAVIEQCEVEPGYWSTVFHAIDTLANSALTKSA